MITTQLQESSERLSRDFTDLKKFANELTQHSPQTCAFWDQYLAEHRERLKRDYGPLFKFLPGVLENL